MTPPAFVVGIDPGDPGAVAVLAVGPAPTLLYWADARTGHRPATPQLIAAICRATAAAEQVAAGLYEQTHATACFVASRDSGARPLLLAVEGQFVGANPHSVIELAHSAGQWIEAGLALGLIVEVVAPSTWQAAELSGGRRWKSAQLEAAARDKAGALFPEVRERAPHVHAAILIARWAALRAFWGPAKRGARGRA